MAVRDLASYIPKLQDQLRRNGFPVDVSGEMLELSLDAEGTATQRRRTHWEFRDLEQQRSIVVGENAISVQSTAYSGFEDFLEMLALAIDAADAIVGDLVLERIGLRYLDAIMPRDKETWEDYVHDGIHGHKSGAMSFEKAMNFVQTIADTGPDQRMIVRLAQNREGQILPPDLVPHHPTLRREAVKGELITLLDFDHFREVRQSLEVDEVTRIAWELHEGLDIMFRDTVTKHALEVWK